MSLLDASPPDETTAGWWDATRAHRLVLQTCTACGGQQHPPRSVCLRCGTTDGLGWVPANGSGVVDSFTVVHRAAHLDAAVPYVIARVRVAEGPILLTRLEGRPVDAWAVGDAVSLAWEDLDDGRALPVFHGVEGGRAPDAHVQHEPTGQTGPHEER